MFTAMAALRRNSSTNSLWSNASKRRSARAMLMLLLLLQWVNSSVKPVAAGAVNTTATVPSKQTNQCVVVLENSQILKQIGSVWISSEDPCAIHTCEMDETGLAYETVTKEDCGQFYCDVDSELRPEPGTCCGACVRTKCRYNDEVFEIGRTWHNEADCTLLECAQLPSGEPMINAYQKTCPQLPPNCPRENIYTENCCQYCNQSIPRSNINEEDEDIWTEEYYRQHPCVRDCQANEAPKTCYYKFTVELYRTLSRACHSCAENVTDCYRPHCIAADGIPRTVTVVNRMMPGPSIEVCHNDLIVVDVKNELFSDSTTIHWHGLHQKDTPYMDGVPHISQCPISPHATFRYSFRASNAGTHFWHSHVGMQRGDGMFGAFIIRRPRSADPHAHLYDFDLPEHKMILQDWAHVPGISMFADHHHSVGDNKPTNILINGRGRYYSGIWQAIKAARAAKEIYGPEARSADTTTTTTSTTAKPTTTTTRPTSTTSSTIENQTTFYTEEDLDDVDFLHPLQNSGRIRINVNNELSRLARLAKADNESVTSSSNLYSNETLESAPVTLKLERTRRSTGYNISLDQIPHQVYTVREGFRYRFRIINAEFLNCPVALSVDNHTLTAINSDGYDVEAVEVGSIVTYAGERFDFILHANQTPGSYWIRLKGLMDCSEVFTSAFQVAILRYEDTDIDAPPNGELAYAYKAPGIELNAMNVGSGQVDTLTIAELNALGSYDNVPGVDRDALKPVADYKFFAYYDFYAKDNPTFHSDEHYSFNDTGINSNRLFTPQINHISLKFPSLALLPMRDQIDDSMFCNETTLAQQGIDCRTEFCKCHHVLQVPLGAIVEFILVDEGFTFDANHPFHLHGNAFRVVALERLGTNVTIEMVKQLDRYNLLKRNLIRPPIKDTVTVPDGGYTIIRFEAYNPGFWIFHCHIEFHAEIGMALILKVGDNDQMMPVPKHFPTCHDYKPNPLSEDVDCLNGESCTTDSGLSAKPPTDDSNNGNTIRSTYVITVLLTLLVILLRH